MEQRRLTSMVALAAAAAALLPLTAVAESPVRDCGNTAGYQTNAPWPGRSRCPTGLSLSAYEGPNDGFVAWSPSVGTVYRGAAIAADGSVYVGNAAGELRKFSSTGVQLWARTSGLGAIRNTPAIAASGTVYVATDAGYLRAINPTTGATIWSSVMTGWGLNYVNVPMHGSPVIAPNGTIIVSNDAGLVQAVSSAGAPLWTIQMNGPVYATAALSRDGSTVYVGSAGFELRAYSVATGNLIWASPLLVGGGTPAVAANGTIFVPSSVGTAFLYAIDPATGFSAWPTFLGFTAINDKSPAIAPNGDIVIASDQGLVSAITQSGVVRWTQVFPITTHFETAAIDSQGTIFIPSSDGKLRALRGDTGVKLWEYQAAAGTGIAGLPAINSSNQLVVPLNGKLYALGHPGPWGTLFDPHAPVTPTAPGVLTPANQGVPGGSTLPYPVQVIAGGVPSLTYTGDSMHPGVTDSVAENGGRFYACKDSGLTETPSTVSEANILGKTKASFDTLKASTDFPACQLVPAPAVCPIDPASLTALNTSCTSNSQCPNGASCVYDCGSDGECTNAPQRCGYPYSRTHPSCDTLPAITKTAAYPPDNGTGTEPAPCAEIRECMFTDGVPHNPWEEAPAYMDCGGSAPVDSPPADGWLDYDPACRNGDTGMNPPGAAAAESPPRRGTRCKLSQENPQLGSGVYDATSSLSEGGGKPPSGTTTPKKWDLSLKPNASHSLDIQPKALGRGKITSANDVSFLAVATINGTPFTLFDLAASAKLSTCDVSADAKAKLFGNLIDLQIGTGFNHSANMADTTACNTLVGNADSALNAAKGAMMKAKAAMAMFKPDIRSPELVITPGEYSATGIPNLPTSAAIPLAAATPSQQSCTMATQADPNGASLVTAADCAATYSAATAANIINTYVNRYNGAMVAADSAIAAERDRLATLFHVESGPIQLLNADQQFRETFFHATFPIGPIPLDLEVEGSGRYGVSGELLYSANLVEINGLPPGVRATFRAGPNTKLSVLAFVGIGFSFGPLSAKVGIAGQVNLIDIAVPLYAGLSLQRGVPSPDTRPALDSTKAICGGATGCGFGAPYAYPNIGGFPLPDLSFEPKKYRWDLNYNMGVSMTGSALSGEVDVMARIRFFFFSKTFKKRLVKIKGFPLTAEFVKLDTGGELPNLFDLGSLVPEITFPLLPNVTAAQLPGPTDLYIKGWAEKVTTAKLQGFVKNQLNKVQPGTNGVADYQQAVGSYVNMLSCYN